VGNLYVSDLVSGSRVACIRVLWLLIPLCFFQSALEQAREHGIARGGLYGFFVKGETLEPTFADFSTATATPDATPSPSIDAMGSGVDGNGKSANGAVVSLKRKRDDGKARSGGKDRSVEPGGYKKMSDKKNKIKREKAKREVRRGIKSRLGNDAASESYVDESKVVEDENAVPYETAKEARRAKRTAASKVQEADEEERNRKKEEQTKAKGARRSAAVNNTDAVADDSNGQNVEAIANTSADISNRDSRASRAEQSSIQIPEKPLSNKKKAKYAKRAAEKGMSLEDYINKKERG
jgi:hypothetical protein